MRIAAKLAVISSTLLLAACTYHRPPVVYTTPSGQVIGSGSDPRTAADHALETTLRAELNRYGDLANLNPNLMLHADNGIVTLSGPVRSERDRQMIATLVRNTPGVTNVKDHLQVVYPPTGVVTPPTTYIPPAVTTPSSMGPRIEAVRVGDEPLARRISEQLRLSSVPADWLRDVTIRVNNGTAYVQGYVATQQQRQAIDAALQRVRGITAVYDQLQFR